MSCNKLICPECGNTKRFYKSVFLEAKVRVSSTGKTLKKVYDMDTENYTEYEGIYCCECDEKVYED